MFTKIVAAGALAAIASAKKQDVCRALAMSGGGSNGAWEAGVIYGLVNYGDPADFEWDVVTGVSAGSINSLGMSGWAKGTEIDMAQWMSDLWNSLTTSDIWVDWPLGKVSGLLIMGGAVDNSPLLNLMISTMDAFPDFARRITISSVNVNTGEYHDFDQTNTSWRDMPAAAHCSASIPALFPPHIWKNLGVFMDGGTVYNINLESAITQCLELVDDESQIIIDALICGSPSDAPAVEEIGKTWNNYFRARDISKYYGGTDSIAATQLAHPKVQLRYVLKQETGLSGMDEVSFESELTWPLQEAGRQAA